MAATHNALAVDLGASSGRCIAAAFDGSRVSITELNRFENGPVRIGEAVCWNTPRLYSEILAGLALASKRGIQPATLAVDTWGVDYGLLSSRGELLGLPRHYRDPRTNGIMEKVHALVPRASIYASTGIQFMALNTLYQLAADTADDDGRFSIAHRLLFTPDLLGFWLSGEARSERTIASTSQALDAASCQWVRELLAAVRIPPSIMPEVHPPARPLGALRRHIREETGAGNATVIAAAGHDTACAVAAVPAVEPGPWAYISSGTWSLVGMEIHSPIRSPASMHAGFTNELGVADTVRFHRNVAGLWILQECQRTWAAAGREHRIDHLLASADSAPPFTAVIDPDDARFSGFCDMPAAIRSYLTQSGQPAPDDATLVRIVLESLALAYSECIASASSLTGVTPARIHIVGGGSQNRLLCQFTADVTGTEVLAGPVEATAIGNAMIQSLAMGEVASLSQIRSVIAASFPIERYSPRPASAQRWQDAAATFRRFRTAVRDR